eukprot:Plantae.Rhodophyta-Palmaria_palmata.ctg5517.p2 GENE.Plantae.Rhodophyta-Palmaria_palmata.ctg5517~~Plantae.Rhodophyta-Palmaria_palmata.ctg5517.p2  ORF type:complete len:110 (-),score=17.76 Plantae.Rhodophyta-Palmaria_palmata.ctg5517:80-409(-)
MFVDSYSLFQIVAKSGPVMEKRLLVDAAVLQQAYSEKSLSNLGFCRTRFNISDCLSKDVVGETALHDMIKSGKLDHPIAEYVLADENLPEAVDTPSGSKEVDLSFMLNE